jgi:hypothetical protein
VDPRGCQAEIVEQFAAFCSREGAFQMGQSVGCHVLASEFTESLD